MDNIQFSQMEVFGDLTIEELKMMQDREASGDILIIFLTGSRALRRRNERKIRKAGLKPIFRKDGFIEFLIEQMGSE